MGERSRERNWGGTLPLCPFRRGRVHARLSRASGDVHRCSCAEGLGWGTIGGSTAVRANARLRQLVTLETASSCGKKDHRHNKRHVEITGRGVRVGHRGVRVHGAVWRVGTAEPECGGHVLQFIGAGFSRRPARREERGAPRARGTRRSVRSVDECSLYGSTSPDSRPQLLQGQALPLLRGYARFDIILAVRRADRPLPPSPAGRGDLLYDRLSGQRGPAARVVAALLCRSERRGGGGLRAGARLGDRPVGAAVAIGCVRGADQLRVYADDAGAGSDLACLARAGAERAVAGGGKCGVRAGGGGAALLAIRRGNPAGAGGPGVARAAADWGSVDRGDRSDSAHRVGTDALQRSAIRQSVRIRSTLPIGRRTAGYAENVRSALSLVQFPGLFSGAGTLECSFPLRA